MQNPNIEHLESLLERTTPQLLRKSVNKTFMSYLKTIDEDLIPADLKEVIEAHSHLIEFLDKLEQ